MTATALPPLPKSAADAQAQLKSVQRDVVKSYGRYMAKKRETDAAHEDLERQRDRLMMVRLVASGEFEPGQTEVCDEFPLLERRRYFGATDLGRQARMEEALANAARSTNGVSRG